MSNESTPASAGSASTTPPASGERIGLVWNPSKIGEDELRAALDSALERSAAHGKHPDVEWFETSVEDPGVGASDAAIAAGCTVVIAAGGDGTVRAVADRLGADRRDADRPSAYQSGADEHGPGQHGPDEHRPGRLGASDGQPTVELGIVPLGTGNLLARNLHVPLGDPAAAFERVFTGDAAPLDLGRARVRFADGNTAEHSFVVMVGFGIDAQMIVETDDELKARAGWLAYLESLGRAASGTEVVEFPLTLDSGDPQRERAHTLLIANCGTLQGGFALLPDAAPDDGELDLLALRADDVGAWFDTLKNLTWDNGLKRLITGAGFGAGSGAESGSGSAANAESEPSAGSAESAGSAASSGSTEHRRAREVHVELPRPLAFEIDGDNIGEVTEFHVVVLPSALRVR